MEFLYDHTGVFAVKHGTQTYFYRKDAQANIVELLDTNGDPVVKYKYDAWGNCKVLNTSGVEITDDAHIGVLNPFRYRSYYYDTETGFYFLKTRYYDPEIGRFMTIDDISYLDPESINGLNLYAYCLNNPIKYSDPNGTSILLAIGILIGSLIVAGGIIGGVSAGLSGGSVGDVFAGIGKGMLVGGLVGAAISLIIGGFVVGGTSVIGSIMATYGISATANYIEVAVTQGKKSYSDGYSFWEGVNDVINSMFANTPRILSGRFAIGDMAIWGTKLFSKVLHLPNLLYDTYEFAQYVKAGKAFSFAFDGIFWKTAGKFGLGFGYFMSGIQVFNMGKAIFTQPDFENSKWILY